MSKNSDTPVTPIAGGMGENVPAWERPELVVSAPGGIGATTPGHSVFSAGATISLTAQQDVNLSAARNTAVVVAKGLSMFTYGKANNPNKPNQEAGMQLHAASGNVSIQAQGNSLSLVADKAVEVSSVADAITMGAPKHILLTAGGGALRIDSSGITLTTSGAANFKAAMKELAGPASASTSLELPKPSALQSCMRALSEAASSQAGAVPIP
jgi:type VI secretion system secreted protein VgrG